MLHAEFSRALHRTIPTLEKISPQDRISFARDQFGDDLILTSSFGQQAAVLLHMATQIMPNIRVLFIDTGYLFPETYEFVDQLKDRLNLNLLKYAPASTVNAEKILGDAPYSNTELNMVTGDDFETVMQEIKAEPMARAVEELQPRAWLSGLRRAQNEFRSQKPLLEFQNGIAKFYPIIDWDNRDVHVYLKQHDLPYHPLFEQYGYTSIGNRFEPTVNKEECPLHRTADAMDMFDPKI